MFFHQTISLGFTMINLEKTTESKTFTISVMLIIMLFGFFLRFNDLGHWLDNKDQYFFNSGSIPVTLGVDSYYYIDIANDLSQGKISSFDSQRQFPKGFNKTSPAPLLSVLMASFSFLTNQPLEWIAILIPPFLGVLLAIPAYLLGYTLIISAKIPWNKSYDPSVTAAKITGASVALFSLLSPAFIQRSSIGWCDTDILNVAFVTLFIALATQIAHTKKAQNCRNFFVIYALSLLVFIWWWDQALAPPLLLAGAPFLLSLFFLQFESKKQFIKYILFFVFSLLVLWIWQGNALQDIPRSFRSIFNYIFGKDTSSIFPALEQLVQEQNDSSFQIHALKIAGSTFIYSLSILGLVVLAIISKRYFLFILPLIALEALSYKATRFEIFSAPLLGLGLGTIVFICNSMLRKYNYSKIFACIVFIVSCSFFPIRQAEHHKPPIPTLDPLISEAMAKISTITPEEAVIWTSWGHGHPLVYYSQRNTLADGIYHPASVQYILKYPLATNDSRLSANWIQFYTTHGQPGLNKIFTVLTGNRNNWDLGVEALSELLRAGVEKSSVLLKDKYKINSNEVENVLSFLFPANCPPVYLFMDYKLVDEYWYSMGKRDLKNKENPSNYTKVTINSYQFNNNSIIGSTRLGGYKVNFNNGRLTLQGRNIALTKLSYSFRGNNYSKQYPKKSTMGHTLYLRQNEKHKVQSGVLVDSQVANTVFMTLFFEKQFSNNYFSPIMDESPVYLLCKVNGEKYQHPLSRKDTADTQNESQGDK